MTAPPWLQELRDLLALADYAQRQAALQTWEQRWLVDLHWRRTIPVEVLAPTVYAALHLSMRQDLGVQLATRMVTVTQRAAPRAGEDFVTVSGEAVAVCVEPQGEQRADAE